MSESPQVHESAGSAGAELFKGELDKVTALDPDTAALVFQTAEMRRSAIDQMMWQVPALTLTAQSFLFVIAFGATTTWVARVVMAALGLVVAVAAIQLLLKHRYHEELHSHWLEQFARARGWPLLHGGRGGDVPSAPEAFGYSGAIHERRRRHSTRAGEVARFLVLRRSPYVWIAALALFGVADLIVIGGWVDHLVSAANPFGHG